MLKFLQGVRFSGGDASIFPKKSSERIADGSLPLSEAQEFGQLASLTGHSGVDKHIGETTSIESRVSQKVEEDGCDIDCVMKNNTSCLNNRQNRSHDESSGLVGETDSDTQNLNGLPHTSPNSIDSPKRKLLPDTHNIYDDLTVDNRKRLKLERSKEAKTSAMHSMLGDIHRTGAKCVP
ncbi:hypothetical protein ElyMa_005736700, partial [Elysia marginata]